MVKLSGLVRAALLLNLCMSLPTLAEDRRNTVTLPERVMIATQLYSAITTYYAHWRATPAFDLDQEYKLYLEQILSSSDRRQFSLASEAFIAKLGNGHSNFYDAVLMGDSGKRLGFYAMPLHGEWTVISSQLESLHVGDVILTIDGQKFADFYESNERFVSASDGAERAAHLFYHRYLFPQEFTLGLEDGRKVTITRQEANARAKPTVESNEDNGVLYVRVPGFDSPDFENAAVAAISTHLQARAVIVDVRGNGGGDTPSKLISILMDRPYQQWSEATSLRLGVMEVHEEVGTHPTLHWSAALQSPPPVHYAGQLLILTDVRCISACEDFVEPFKANHRAMLVGTRTAGSSGQPYFKDLGNGFEFRVSTKREYFPDGSEFEGVGIAPDIEIEPTPAQLRSGRDPVLAKARTLIQP